MSSPLELDGARLQEMIRAVGRKLGPMVDSLPEQPTLKLDGSRKLAARLDEPPPEQGTPFRRLLGMLTDAVIPSSLNTASPGYLGFIPGGGLVHAAVADLLLGVANRYTGLWMPAPGLVQLEISVIKWLCTWVGYEEGSAGILTSGGSMANLSAVVAARQREPRWREGILYTSALTHHSVQKAAKIAGFLPDQVHVVGTDGAFRMCPAALLAAIEADRRAGRVPLAVVASAGSTAVGAIDPLDALADLCEAQQLWLHVDGAYGGCFVLTERGRDALRGIARADSIALDPHKGLFLPYGTGCLLVRRREHLRAAFSVASDYLPPPSEDADRWDFADLGPELSRPARGLRLWLPLKMHGVGAFRDTLDEKLDLARYAARAVREMDGVRMVTGPALSLFTFRVEPAGTDPDTWDGLNKRILARVNARQRVFLTGATVPEEGGRHFVIRVCVLSFRTHQDRIDVMISDLRDAIADPRG
jgi:aromatic-L-amino-acid decarboxylase